MKVKVLTLLLLLTSLPTSGRAQTQTQVQEPDPLFDQDPALLDSDEKRAKFARDYAKRIFDFDDILSAPVPPVETPKKAEEVTPKSTRRQKKRAAQQLARIIQRDQAILRTGIEDVLRDFARQLPNPREQIALAMEQAVRSEAIAQAKLKPFTDAPLASGNAGIEKPPVRSDSVR